jgi:hypothetical protein
VTPQEQQQMDAAIAYMERMCGNLAREGATAAAVIAAQGQRIKALEAEVASLKPKDNVVPITEPK